MSTVLKRAKRNRSIGTDGTVIYHGIKIAPILGKRSPVAEYIRNALRAKAAERRADV